MTLKQVTEALVFASQKPLTPKEIVAALRSATAECEEAAAAELAKTKEAAVLQVLEELRVELEQSKRAYLLVEKVNGWQLVSHPDCGLWVRQLYPESKPTRLSGPALETLAIIAYRQPIMRADIEAVRGVAVDGVVQSLLERGLIRIAGRADIPGRPLLYETTEFFLEHFGLKSVEELPNAGELRKINLPTAPEPKPAAGPAKAPEAPQAPEEPAPVESTGSAKPAEPAGDSSSESGQSAAAAGQFQAEKAENAGSDAGAESQSLPEPAAPEIANQPPASPEPPEVS